MKILYILSIFFCFYSINILIKEANQVTFTSIDNDRINYQFLICSNLKERLGYFNKTEVHLDSINKDLYNHFNKLIKLKKIKNIKLVENYFLSSIERRDYLIFNRNVCFRAPTNNDTLLNQMQNILKKFNYYSFNNISFDLIKSNNYTRKVHQLLVLNKQSLGKNCIPNYSKSICLNNCIKTKHRLIKYLYSGKESGHILLNYDDNNRTIIKNELNCVKKCKDESCSLVYFIPKNIFMARTTIFEAQASISNFDYFIQIISLICLFTNVTLYKLLSKTLDFIIEKKDEYKKHFACFKILIFLISLICCLILYIQMGIDYEYKKMHPNQRETTMNLFKPETMNLIICIPVNNILMNDYVKDFKDQKLYENKTFIQIEKETNMGFNATVDQIYLEYYQSNKSKVDWALKPYVLFEKKCDSFRRCFQVEVVSSEPIYRRLLSISKLIIIFKHSKNRFYLEPGQNFSSKGLICIIKSTNKRSNKSFLF